MEAKSEINRSRIGNCRCRLRRRGKRLLVAAAASSSGLLLGSPLAHAAIDTWTGQSSADWNSTTGAPNWLGNNPPVTGDSLVFTSVNTQGNSTLTDSLTSSAFNIAGMTFNSGSIAYTMTGNAFSLTGGITNNSTSVETINNAISLSTVEPISTTSGGGNITLAGSISGSTGGLTTAGPGTVILSGGDTYIGNTVVNAGTLSLTGSLSSSSTLVLGGGTFSYAPTSASSQTLNGLTVNAGGSAINVNANGLLNLGTITRNTGGAVVFTVASGGNVAASNSVGTNNSVSPYGILGPWAIVSNTGTALNGGTAGYTYATVTSGNITPYTGAISVTSGNPSSSSTSSNNDDWSTTGNTYFGASRTLNTLRITGTSALTLGNGDGNLSVALTLNGILNAGGGLFQISTVNSTAGDTGLVSVVIGGNANNDLVLAAEANPIEIDTSIVNNGATPGYVTVTGQHSVRFTGVNTFSGGLYLDGTGSLLRIDNAAALGTGTFTIEAGTIENTSGSAITDSNNNTQAWNGDFSFTGLSGNTTGDLNLGTGAVILGSSRIVTTTAGNLTVGGAIGDGGSGFSLTKAGAGSLILSGASTYSGGTNLSAGILEAAASTTSGSAISSGPLGTGTLSLNGGTLEDNGTAITLANSVSINGNTTFSSAGSGNLTFDGTALTSPSTVAVTANTTLTVTNTTTIKDSISGGTSLSITKAGLGALVLAGSDSYAGSLLFGGNNTGTIVLGNSSSLGVSSAQLYFGPYTGNTLDIATNGSDFPSPAIPTPDLTLRFSPIVQPLASASTIHWAAPPMVVEA